MLHCAVSGLAKQKYEPAIFLCKETIENGQWSKDVTTQLNYATIKLSSDSQKIHQKKENNFVSSLFILVKVATKWQLLTLLFRKSKGENKSQICNSSRYFSHKGKKFSSKCDWIGPNFEACTMKNYSVQKAHRIRPNWQNKVKPHFYFEPPSPWALECIFL